MEDAPPCDKPGCTIKAVCTCSGCFGANYCSNACQISHWKLGHNRSCTGLVESKSLTKSALGLAYAHVDIAEDAILVTINGVDVNVGDALRHTSGFHTPFDYFEFVAAEDAAALSKDRLSESECEPGLFRYSDYMYQLLASEFERLSKGRHLDGVLRELLGEGGCFKWTRDKTGNPLGPNGLYLNVEAANQLGKVARHLLKGKKRSDVPLDADIKSHYAEIVRYVHGWWETSSGDLLGIGYRAYYIIAPKEEEDVYVQLFEDDYQGSLTKEQEAFPKRVLGQ